MSSVPLSAYARAASRVVVLAGVLLLASSCGGDGKCVADLCITEQRIGLDIALSSTSTGSGRVDATYPEGHSCHFDAGSNFNQCHTSFNDAGAGGQVFLTATPDPGSTLAGWSGCSSVNGNQCTLAFSAASGDTTLSAVVVLVVPSNRIRLTVSSTGAGAGHVSITTNYGSFPNFSCDFPSASGCSRTHINTAGAGQIDLEASPTEGSAFVGWTGCTPYTDRPQRCQVGYPAPTTDQDLAVTARFDLVAAACTNPVTIQDDFTSADAGWTATATTSGGSPTQSVTFQAADGNPGGYRQMQHVFTGASAIAVYHYYGTTTYDPSTQGAIDHINYFEDQIELNPPSPGAAVGTGFSMMQGGTRYNIILRPPGGAFTNTDGKRRRG